jgi:hypothetical protein
MRNILLLVAVISTCMGCSASQGSTPDYEIRGEQVKDGSNLKTKTINVSTESIKEHQLRQIAAELKSENPGYDALSIQFHRDRQGQGAPQEAGTAIVVNNEEAANRMLPDILFTDADRRKILNEENDGILVISRADIKQAEQEMQKETREMQKDLEQEAQESEKKVKRGLNQMDQELQDMQKGMEQDLEEMEKEMEKAMPKP